MAHSAAQRRPRVVALIVGLLFAALLIVYLSFSAPAARAADGDPPAGDEPKAAPGNGDSPATPTTTPNKASSKLDFFQMIWHVVTSAGIVFGGLLLIISTCLVALVILLILDLRLSGAIPPAFVEDFTDTINKRKFKEAFEMAKEEPSYLGRVLTTGMGRLQYGLEDAREAANAMTESIKASKEQFITFLATIGTLGPLLGLVGTVYGMIQSFSVLGKTANPAASDLADGISHALAVTLLGVSISVPAIFFHAFFRNRLIRISMETGAVADDLLTQMYYNSRKAAATAAPTLEAAQPAPKAAPSVNATAAQAVKK
jgi:biopolymer transport protein ExbB